MSSEENKPGLGFRTAATELQDRFEKLSKEVENKEKEWSELIKFVASLNKEIIAKVTTEGSVRDIALINLSECLITLANIGQLGKTLANIDGRVVNIEKSIERLHLKVK
jgi:hypothetical protein